MSARRDEHNGPLPHQPILGLEERDEGDAQHIAWLLERGEGCRFELRRLPVGGEPEAVRRSGCELLLLGLRDGDREGGLERVATLRRALPEVALVVVGDAEPALGEAMIGAGAQEFLIKTQLDPATLCRALLHARRRLGAPSRGGETVVAEKPGGEPQGKGGAAARGIGDAASGDAMAATMAAAILDRLPSAVLFLDPRLRVLMSNRAARALLEATPRLRLGGERLHAERGDDDQALRRLVAQALDGAEKEESATALRLDGGGGAGGAPLHLVATAVGRETSGVALFLSDPEAPTEISTAILASLYGLTPAEAKLVAALARGHSLERISSQIHVTLHTLRSHLKQIFRKTGTSRQPELVKLVLTGPAVLPPHKVD